MSHGKRKINEGRKEARRGGRGRAREKETRQDTISEGEVN